MEPVDLRGVLIELEYAFIDKALAETNSLTEAARILGLKRTTLIEKRKARMYRTQGGLYDPQSKEVSAHPGREQQPEAD